MPTDTSMYGRICLVTGATSGIGRVTALALAQQGATVLLVARDAARGEGVADEIMKQTGNPKVHVLVADLSSLAQVRSLAHDVIQRYVQVHVLLNNAGAVFMRRQVTADGLEKTFALNVLAPFLLTNLLLDTLKASAPSRIINVASAAHIGQRLPFDDLQFEHHRYHAFQAYGESKLADILFTYELARRLEGTGVTVNTLHPGFVATNFAKGDSDIMRVVMTLIRPFAISPERGAQTSIHLATSPDVQRITGKYFAKEKPVRSSRASTDVEAQRRLWDVCARLTGLTQPVAAPE